MAELRVLIVDDEPLARSSLRRLLAPHADVVVAGECQDGWEAVEFLGATPVDLVFLDVQMPELDGFGVVRELGAARMPRIVFVTAFDEFAVAAFEVHALDYLVKPFTDERFEAMLARAREQLRYRDLAELGDRLAGLLHDTASGRAAEGPPSTRQPYAKRLLVPSANRSLVIRTSTIDWVQADDYYAALHVAGRRHLLRETMAALEAKLDPELFLRIHRSVIVNLECVQRLERSSDGQLTVVLMDGTRLPVSRSRREGVEAALGHSAR